MDINHLQHDPDFQAFMTNSHTFFNKQTDWKVGWDLWKALSDDVKQQIMDQRKKARDAEDSGGNVDTQRKNPQQQVPVTSSIIKPPPAKTAMQGRPSAIPMQYSSNAKSVEFDPDPQTQLEAFCEKTAMTIHVSPQFLPHFQTAHVHNQHITRTSKAIIDSGADSHVGDGNSWLPLLPLSGPGVCFANIKG